MQYYILHLYIYCISYCIKTFFMYVRMNDIITLLLTVILILQFQSVFIPYTGWTQKQSLISSSYKIKIYWNIFINMGLQIH